MTNPELVASILKKGGHILVVGGEVKDLPRQYHEHPQIILWDDNQQDLNKKVVPVNTKVIMYNRWVSHNTAKWLSNEAKNLHALKFPMLKAREIKELLAEVVQAEPIDASDEVIEQQIKQINSDDTPEIKEDNVAKKTILGSGVLKKFIAKHLNLNIDYTAKGSKTKEGRRLFSIAQKEGVKTTQASVINSIAQFIKELEKGRTTKPLVKSTREKTSTVDDFEELGRLISDAIIAMKLVQEHLPKVRKETEKLRSMKSKFLKLLE